MAKKKKPAKQRLQKLAVKRKVTISPRNNSAVRWTLVILLITVVAYIPSLTGAFVWDDTKYVQNNPLITSIDLRALFSTNVMGNYHPLTMLVYAIEYHFFGLSTTGYHVVNLLVHSMNALLVFFVILRLSNNSMVALIGSAFFGIHPLHVESVAWISELKDLLYTFFFLGAYVCYLKYLEVGQRKMYYFCLLLFVASLLSKGMAVSFPVALVLTDFFKEKRITGKRLFEKIPFLALAIVFGIIAIYAQKSSEAIQDLERFSFFQRVIFASYGLITYLLKLLIPVRLSAFYPYPIRSGEALPAHYYLYLLLVLLLIWAMIYFRRKSNKIFFGIGFFVVTIFLVLQLLPVGDAIMADRYSYVPSVGIFYLAGEGIYWLWSKKNTRSLSFALAGIFIIFFSIQTYLRSQIWGNGLKLWSDVIEKYPQVAVAYNNRGGTFMIDKRYDEALHDYNTAIALRPDYYDAYNNRGILLSDMQRKSEALSDYNKAIQFGPKQAEFYSNRGLLLMEMNNNKQALADLNKAIDLKSNFSQAYYNRGLLAMNEKRNEDALNDYAMAIKFNPAYMEAYINRGVLFYAENKFDEAIVEYNRALQVAPSNPQIFFNRGLALMMAKKYPEAINDFSKTLELKGEDANAYYNRGMTFINSGRKDIGCQDLQSASRMGLANATAAIAQLCR